MSGDGEIRGVGAGAIWAGSPSGNQCIIILGDTIKVREAADALHLKYYDFNRHQSSYSSASTNGDRSFKRRQRGDDWPWSYEWRVAESRT